jgi:uncharacterized protein
MTPVHRGFDLKPVDGTAPRALEAFKARLTRCYREHLKAVYLFGSRTRGDHRPDSDMDVAVFG